MRIRCDQCGAKYQVSDDKVRHKVFKIRCKRCENVIIVRANEDAAPDAPDKGALAEGTQTGDNDATRQVQQSAAGRGPDASAVWHIVVNREQVGPITPQDVAGYLGRGEVTGDAFVWKEGLGDWQKMSGIPEFAHLFDETQGSAPPTADKKANHSDKAGLSFPADKRAEDDVIMSSGPDGDSQDPFAQVESANQEGLGNTSAADRLRGQRNDNSVLFSLDALDAADEAPVVTNTGGTDGSGLIDISLLENLGGGDSAGVLSNDDGVGALGAIGTPAQMPSIVNRRRGNGGLIVAIILGSVIIAAGVGGAFYLKSQDDAKSRRSVTSKDSSKDKGKTSSNDQQVAGSKVDEQSSETSKPSIPLKRGSKASAGGPQASGAVVSQTNANGQAMPPSGSQGPPAMAKGQAATDPAKAASGPGSQNAAKASAKTTVRSSAAKKPKSASSTSNRRRSSSRAQARNRSRARAAAAPKKAPKASAPKPAAQPPAPARAAKKAPASGGDEVDDLLSGLNGGGSARAKPKPTRSRPAAPAPAADPLLPEKLGKRDIMSVIKRNSRKVLSCKSDDPSLGGVVKVRIVISPSGRVSNAEVISGNAAGTSVGRCVSNKARSFRFPKFRGPSPMSITVPFRL